MEIPNNLTILENEGEFEFIMAGGEPTMRLKK